MTEVLFLRELIPNTKKPTLFTGASLLTISMSLVPPGDHRGHPAALRPYQTTADLTQLSLILHQTTVDVRDLPLFRRLSP